MYQFVYVFVVDCVDQVVGDIGVIEEIDFVDCVMWVFVYIGGQWCCLCLVGYGGWWVDGGWYEVGGCDFGGFVFFVVVCQQQCCGVCGQDC